MATFAIRNLGTNGMRLAAYRKHTRRFILEVSKGRTIKGANRQARFSGELQAEVQ